MTYEPHYISSYDENSGQFTYTEPFLAPEKAFPLLENAFCWRNRVKKKLGTVLLGRLRRGLTKANLGNIVEAWGGAYPHDEVFNIFTILGLAATEPYAQIQPLTLDIHIGAPISQELVDTLGTGVLDVVGAGLITNATINYNTGDLTITFSGPAGASAATADFSYYPSLPVMGCRLQELPTVNDENTIFFDTKYAYLYNPATTQFDELPSVAATVWHGSDSDFFWTTNYWQNATADLFWATNDNMTGATRDPIKYYDTSTWTNFAPLVNAVDTLYNARIILPYKDRLVFMNTWEGTTIGTITAATNLPQRIRWSWNGDPLHADAFRSERPGFGGYLDAPTNEQIVGAEFIKDTLLVKFERSSWKLVYTGNEILPFIFQKINTELGSESTFSLIPFDAGVFSVGNVGITSDDSVNVQRIDLQIPDTVFKFNNDNAGTKRVYGIRDYWNELVYWTYPDSNFDDTDTQSSFTAMPNRVLCYNYRNNTWATFIDSFTCYGYWQRGQDLAWFQLPYASWEAWPGLWNSGVTQSKFPDVVAGNQQGFVSIVQQQTVNDVTRFIYSYDLANLWFFSHNHNLYSDDVVLISGVTGSRATALNGKSFVVTRIDGNNFTLNGFVLTAADTYFGGGLITVIDNFKIRTKVFAPFYDNASQCRLGYIDYLFAKTANGQIIGDVFINENDSISMTDSNTNTALLGSNTVNTRVENTTLVPFQAQQSKIWHRQYVQVIVQNFTIQLTMSQDQLLDSAIRANDVILHAMAIYLTPNARLVD